MRVLWISFLGSWTEPLLKQLAINNDIKIGLAIPKADNGDASFKALGIDIFYVPVDMEKLHKKMSTEVFFQFNEVIENFKPDIIHVHGTEKNIAQIQEFNERIPVVISIQGIMMGCRRFSLNYLEKKDYLKYSSVKNFLGYGGAAQMRKLFINSYKYEMEIFQKGKYFIGRTDWDRAHVFFRNPEAKYYHGEELLRTPFYEKAQSWSIDKCEKYTVFISSGFTPLKGLHWAIEAIALLKNIYPGIKLMVPGIPKRFLAQSVLGRMLSGENYITYCLKKIKQMKVEDNVFFLPHLTSNEMVEQMQKAHVFLSPSSIDNSPNAIGEAMTIGIPVVTTPVGGITSFLQDKSTCLFAPAGDPYLMAFQIKRIFESNELAFSLSSTAYLVAEKRHNQKGTGEQYFSIYKEITQVHPQ